jgi:flagellar L-ring protein precursor FlgH
MKRTIGILAAAVAVAAAVRPAPAGSIWAKSEGLRGRRSPLVYEDDKARGIGDVLTIIIKEQSEIDNETKRANDKTTKRSAKSEGSISLEDIAHYWGKDAGTFNLPKVSAESESKNEFEGNADYEADRKIEDQVTVVVQDVLPNGNLVVAGTRQRHVDGDAQIIRISGIVRPSDVTFANTVKSELVADFQMIVDVQGLERRYTRPGWLGRFLNWISPW